MLGDALDNLSLRVERQPVSGDVENEKAVSLRRILADPSYNTVRRCAPDYLETGELPAPATALTVMELRTNVSPIQAM